MTQPVEDTEQDLPHIHWSWPEAIAVCPTPDTLSDVILTEQANPAGSLANADLALDYFAYSPFFDSKSNNSVLRTQRRVENPTYGHAQERLELPAFRSGFEYVVAHALPPALFVIHRREVAEDGKRDQVSAVFFILHDRTYMSPTLWDVMSNRLRNATHLVAQTFNTLSANHPPSNPRATSTWRSLPPEAAKSRSSTTAVGAAPVPDSEDVDMGSPSARAAEDFNPEGDATTGAAPSQAKTKGDDSKAPSQPDLFLYNALAATRSSLSRLDSMASGPEPRATPEDELKAIEAALSGGTAHPGGQAKNLPNPIPSRIGAANGSHLRTGASPLGSTVARSTAGMSPAPTAR